MFREGAQSELPKYERETADPQVALRLGATLTSLQHLLPELSYEGEDTDVDITLSEDRAEELERIAAQINADGLAKYGLGQAVGEIKTMLAYNAEAGIKSGRQKRNTAEGKEVDTFETAFATHILFKRPEDMVAYNPRIPMSMAKRISGFDIGHTPQRKYLGAREKEGGSFTQIIRHEDRHVWDNLFERAWKDRPFGDNSADLAPKEVASKATYASPDHRTGYGEFYKPDVQNYVRKELSAFFCEGATEEEMLTRFLGSLDEDSYNFSDPRLYRMLGFYYPDAGIFKQEVPEEFAQHYGEIMTESVCTYFHILKQARARNPDSDEIALRNMVANILIFAPLKDMSRFYGMFDEPELNESEEVSWGEVV